MNLELLAIFLTSLLLFSLAFSLAFVWSKVGGNGEGDASNSDIPELNYRKRRLGPIFLLLDTFGRRINFLLPLAVFASFVSTSIFIFAGTEVASGSTAFVGGEQFFVFAALLGALISIVSNLVMALRRQLEWFWVVKKIRDIHIEKVRVLDKSLFEKVDELRNANAVANLNSDERNALGSQISEVSKELNSIHNALAEILSDLESKIDNEIGTPPNENKKKV